MLVGVWRGILSGNGQLSTRLVYYSLTKRLSSVRSTATPASTLPTVKETSIVEEMLGSLEEWLTAYSIPCK